MQTVPGVHNIIYDQDMFPGNCRVDVVNNHDISHGTVGVSITGESGKVDFYGYVYLTDKISHEHETTFQDTHDEKLMALICLRDFLS